jgi:hypothetical protein
MYEPFNFKGNLDDFPLTMRYGRRVDDLRERYKEFLWDAEFRDTLEAHVMSDGKPYLNYSVFRSTSNGKHAVVVVNNEASGMQTVQVSIDGAPHDALMWTAPETPTTHPYKGGVSIPARSAVVLIEQ